MILCENSKFDKCCVHSLCIVFVQQNMLFFFPRHVSQFDKEE